jgi:hypothetical protein
MLAAFFNQYHPNVKALICFLKLMNVKVNKTTVDETLQNHPDWPSLLSVSDALHLWDIPNAAGKMSTTDIDQLPTPFLAYTNHPQYPLSIVTKTSEDAIEYYRETYLNAQTKPINEFLEDWTGIYLVAEPNASSGEKQYVKKRKDSLLQQALPLLMVFMLLTASFLLFMKQSWIVTNNWWAAVLQFVIYATGIIITSLLLWYEIDKNNPLLQKVCTGIAKGNCNAILTGKQAKLFSWLSWSEVGFFWFTGGFLILLFGTAPANIYFLGWLNLLVLPYPAFSVYYQWRVAKQWCVLCLAVQALLLVGAAVFLFYGTISNFSFLSLSFVGTAFLMYAVPLTAWYVLKPYVLQLQQAKNTNREYLRIKFNTEIFDTLLKKQKQITIPVDGLGIEIGNPNAKHTLVKVCNPYCGPCSKAHEKIEELLHETDAVKLKIIFTAPNDPENKMYKPVSHLLAIEEKYNNESILKEALDRWYLNEQKEYEPFAAKYPMNGELQKQTGKIEAMYNWCNKMEIMATPTIFIDGYQLPDAYNVKDLKYFLQE